MNGGFVSNELVAWAKQHIEWTLEDGAADYPDGVLMILIDENGQAAMSVGPFHELERRSLNHLIRRADDARRERDKTGVAPECLWAVKGDELIMDLPYEAHPSGASTLVNDIARTIGMPVRRGDDLFLSVANRQEKFDEVFLVSDEYGVVPASDMGGVRAHKYAGAYQRLLMSTKK